MSKQKKRISMMSGGGLFAFLFMIALVIAGFYRFTKGLGGVSNLNDDIPWGLWIGVDVLAGVALASGGFTIAGAVYIFNLKKYKPITRAAVLTAFIGYIMVSVSIFFDIGKPQTIWHPLVLWNNQSIMFEVVWCVVIYTAVLALEFAGPFLEKVGARGLGQIMTSKKVLIPLAIAAVILSFLHQSSMGALFLFMSSKLNHLWWTTMLPYNFFISAVAAGLAMVSFEYAVSSAVFHHPCDMGILRGLGKGTAIVLLAYFILRIGDLIVKDNLGLMFATGPANILFMIEMVALTFLPMILLFKNADSAIHIRSLLFPQSLVLLGVIMNRLNILFLAQYRPGASYSPSFIEWVITIGLIATIVFVYRFSVIKLPISYPVKIENQP